MANEEWKNKKLSEFAEITMGQSPSSSFYNENKNGYPFLQGNRTFGFLYPTYDTWTTHLTKLAKKGDVIMSVRAPVGDINIAPTDLCLGRGVCSIRMKNGENRFLFYLLKANINSLLNKGNGTVFSSINRDDISNLEVLIPSEESQKRIAFVLSKIDDKIETNNRIIMNLEEQVITIWNHYFNVTLEKQTTKGWKRTTLGGVTENIRDRVNNGNYRVFSALNSGKLQFSDEYFTKQVFSKDISKYIIVEENYFAYNPARINIGSIGINDLGCTGCVSPVYVVFKTKENYHYYMKYFIKSAKFKTEAQTRASGSVRQSLNYSDFSLIEIMYPPKELIDLFNAIYKPIYEKQKVLTSENNKLIELKEYLLPKMMNGNIDLSKIIV